MPSKAGGFITLHRKILDWEWYSDKNTFRLFVHLLLTVRFADGRVGGRVVKRGQLVTSLTHLANATRLTVRQVRVSLDHLKMTGEVTVESTPRYSVITVVKYDDYQTRDTLNDTLVTREVTNERQTDDTPVTRNVTNKRQHNNNGNNTINNGTIEQGNNKNTFPVKSDDYDFDTFWNAYPKKMAKQEAKKAWMKLKPDEEMMQEILSGLTRWKTSYEWQKNGGQFIPHPASWLNGRRWEDDIPTYKPPESANPAPVKPVAAQQYEQRDYGEADTEAMQRQIEEMKKWGII